MMMFLFPVIQKTNSIFQPEFEVNLYETENFIVSGLTDLKQERPVVSWSSDSFSELLPTIYDFVKENNYSLAQANVFQVRPPDYLNGQLLNEIHYLRMDKKMVSWFFYERGEVFAHPSLFVLADKENRLISEGSEESFYRELEDIREKYKVKWMI